ncbi:methyltransferase family protein [Methanolobus psychrotolerans]|uniref:methyltransferase family protein n=1 Tax=Methanolobus psychrotolerans TaxID=1874706 RepID=UPI000B917A66|nr:isoprenylcysteine carboxylmethyltransferase family protein [Methanolobus psychrotolerans]
MINQPLLAIFLSIPLIVMLFPSIRYWSDYKNEKSKGNNGKKATYNKPFFVLLVIGVLFMWIFWVEGIFSLALNEYAGFLQTMTFSSPNEPAIEIIGLIVFYIGAIMYNANIIVAGKYLRPAPSGTLADQKLIRKGPFSLIRHPLYASYFLILAGLSFVLLNLWILIPAFFILLGIYPTAKTEEEVLIEQFGDEYIEYKNQVGMFFPKLKK